MPDDSPQPDALPTATVADARRTWWVWLIPVAALLFAAALFATYVVKTGPVISIHMAHGYGIKPTDVLRCRGIACGEVERVRLDDDLAGVIVDVRLDPSAEDIARGGSRFWVVRPRLGVGGIAGLETVAGPRYIAVLPGAGERTDTFTALDDPPPVERVEPEGQKIQLVTDRRGSLRPGAPVVYRQFVIGSILSVELGKAGQRVEVWVYVEPEHKHLVRTNSRFANVSGFEWSFGLQGARLDVESLASLLDGGVAVFTPDPPGEFLDGDYRFQLAARAEEDWYKWSPPLEPSAVSKK